MQEEMSGGPVVEREIEAIVADFVRWFLEREEGYGLFRDFLYVFGVLWVGMEQYQGDWQGAYAALLRLLEAAEQSPYAVQMVRFLDIVREVWMLMGKISE